MPNLRQPFRAPVAIATKGKVRPRKITALSLRFPFDERSDIDQSS
jgi:hypothetical protein